MTDVSFNKLKQSYFSHYIDISSGNIDISANSNDTFVRFTGNDTSYCTIDLSYVDMNIIANAWDPTSRDIIEFPTTNYAQQFTNIYGFDERDGKHTVLIVPQKNGNLASGIDVYPTIYKFDIPSNSSFGDPTRQWIFDTSINYTDLVDSISMSYDTRTIACLSGNNIYIYYHNDVSYGLVKQIPDLYNTNIDYDSTTTENGANVSLQSYDTYRTPTLGSAGLNKDGSKMVISNFLPYFGYSINMYTNGMHLPRIKTYTTTDNWDSYTIVNIHSPSSGSYPTDFQTSGTGLGNMYSGYANCSISHDGLIMFSQYYMNQQNEYGGLEVALYRWDTENNGWIYEVERSWHDNLQGGIYYPRDSNLSANGNHAVMVQTYYKRNSDDHTIASSWTYHNPIVSGLNIVDDRSSVIAYNASNDLTYITNNGDRYIVYLSNTNEIRVYKNDTPASVTNGVYSSGGTTFTLENTFTPDSGIATGNRRSYQGDLSNGQFIFYTDYNCDSGSYTNIGKTYSYFTNDITVNDSHVTNIRSPFDIQYTINDTRIGLMSELTGFSATNKNFEIAHPILENKKLRHTCIETPQLANMYSGHSQLQEGKVTIDLDEMFHLTTGTFSLLNKETYILTSNETDFDEVKGAVEKSVFTIECENIDSSANVSWIVFGKRNDKFVYQSNIVDDSGNYITEF